MALFANYVLFAVGLALSLVLAMNLMMTPRVRRQIGGWTNNHELWTPKALAIGFSYCLLISAIATGSFALFAALNWPTWISLFVALLVLVFSLQVFGAYFARKLGRGCPLPPR